MTTGRCCYMLCSRILAIGPVAVRGKGVDHIRVHRLSSK